VGCAAIDVQRKDTADVKSPTRRITLYGRSQNCQATTGWRIPQQGSNAALVSQCEKDAIYGGDLWYDVYHSRIYTVRCSALFCFVLLVPVSCPAQAIPPPQPTELRPASTQQLSSIGVTSIGHTQCDAEGNLYLRPFAPTQSSRDSATIVEWDPKTDIPISYTLPSELAGKIVADDFSVSKVGGFGYWLPTG
jgi:hypothetical protein